MHGDPSTVIGRRVSKVLYFPYYYKVPTAKTSGIPTIKSIAIILIGRVSSSLIGS